MDAKTRKMYNLEERIYYLTHFRVQVVIFFK